MLALLLWILAIYGVFEGLSRFVRYFNSRSSFDRRVTLVLIVYNGEAYMEGILRMIGYKAALSRKDVRVMLIDAGSTDATCEIVKRIREQHEDDRITLVQTDREADSNILCQLWKEAELNSPLFLFDLREWQNQKKIMPYLTRIFG
jgi:glycosyltransferase involved in cell wall biosynthesis